MKKREIIDLYKGINSVLQLPGVIFGFACNRNLQNIKPEVEALQKAVTPSKEFTEYDLKRVEIVKKYALKDTHGEFIINGNAYDVGGREAEIEKEVLPLKDQYKEAIEEQAKQEKEYYKLLDEESTVELYKVKLENIPKDISGEQMKSIFLIVDGD